MSPLLNKPCRPRDDFHELSVAEKKIQNNCIRDYAENPLFAIGKPLSPIEHGKPFSRDKSGQDPSRIGA
jgi:hypothetical protein